MDQHHPSKVRSPIGRGIALLAVATLAAGTLVISPATAGKFLTKKKATKLFYTKGGADTRFINVGELFSSSTQQTALIQNFTGPGDVITHSVTVPEEGTLLVWANVSFEEDGTQNEAVHARVLMDGTQVGTVQESSIEFDGFFSSESIANAVATPVSAGPHTLKLEVESTESVQITIEGRSITTLFIPS